ncbi:MAG: homocysteine S-methyltransferase family protein [Thermoguttaceae bacterium]|nr:homocysteine S-methyltransferase family protein [Thermoguttaceae bacterium]
MSLTFQEALASSTLVFDGATGTEIYRRRVFTNQCYDELNLRNPRMIEEIAAAYRDAGVDVLTTNTYGANRFALEKYGLETQVAAINAAGVALARRVASETSTEERPIFVAGSVGFPSAETLEKRSRTEIVEAFAAQVDALVKAGVDVVLFETQPSRETAEIAVDAMSAAAPSFPFVVSYALSPELFRAPNTLESRAKRFAELFAPFETTDATAKTGVACPCCEVGDATRPQPLAWGLNCGFGPAEMLNATLEIVKTLDKPLIVQPNAGAPETFEGRQLYYNSPEYLATYATRYADLGAAAVGGCCGTTPEDLAEVVKAVKPTARSRRAQITLIDAAPDVVELPESPIESRSRLAAKLARGEWVSTVETIPPRGYDLADFIDKGRRLKEAGVDAVNLPDGPRASARISSIVAASKILDEAGIEPVLHMCCRDKNLIGIQADLVGCAALGIRNILFITGDPPKLGNYAAATGVFDCDSIGLCALQRRLNRGVDLGGLALPPATNAFFGVGFDPSALDRKREIDRLKRKIDAGALFAVTQPVFDPNVLLSFLDECGDALSIPVIAGVWPFVSYRNALFMRKEVPGVVVPDEIMSRMEAAATRSKEDQLATGIEIARESLATICSSVQGVQVSAPLGRIEVSLDVLR